MDLPDLVNHARVEENALGKSGLAGIDMCRNSNVARPLEREGSIGRIGIVGAGFGLKRCRHGKDRLRSRQAEARTDSYGALSSKMPLDAMQT